MNKLTKKNIQDIYALTPMQQGMLFHYLKDPDGEHYFEQLILHINGKINVEFFKKAWKKVAETNEILRTVFRWENLERPIQIVLKKYEPELSFLDFSHEGTSQKKNISEEIKRKDREKKFHLEDVPFRITLCKIEENKYDMVVSNHHILYDGWSNGIILKEFFNTYQNISNGNETVAPQKTTFKEFVRWIDNQDTAKQEVFWSRYLKDFAAISREKEPGRFRTKGGKTINCAGNYQAILATEIKGRLEDFVKRHNITLAPVLYSAWGILLLLLHQGDRVLFDTTVSGRTKEIKGIEDMVGLFINTLPLGIKIREDQNLLALVSGIYQSLQTWEKHENTSQVIVKEYLETCSRETIFDALVVLENYPLEKQLLQTSGELTVDSFSITGGAYYDITLIITIFDEIKFCFTYNQELFNEETMAAISRCFAAVIDEIVTNSFKTVPGIHQLLIEERERILKKLKISRQSRPHPDEIEYTAPGNELEEKVAGIWSTVLSIDKSKIGIDTDFFAFGGHSLKASMLTSLLYQELHVKVPLSEIFHRPTIREQVEYIKGTSESRYARFPGAETKEYYPLSSAQKRFYMLQQLDRGSIAYNAYSFMRLEGKINRDKLEATFSRLIRRHESLRTAFIYHQGEPWQKVLPEVNFSLDYFEITSEESKKIISGFIRPFDLSRAPLMRVGLIELSDENETYILLFDMHHIISDGSSVNILVKEFMELYQGIRLPLQKYQYKDFSEWQNNQLRPGKLKSQEKFWLDQFKGEIPVLDMPYDYPRPAIRSFAGERRVFYLNEILVNGLPDLTRKTGTTLYMVLLAGLGILLNKYSGARDIIIGTPIAGRNHKDLMNIFGLFVEMIVLRIYPEKWKRFSGYLKEIKELTLASFDNQAYPFGELTKKLSMRDDLSRNPLFDIMLIVQNQGRLGLEIDDLKISPLEFENHTSKMDINIEVFELQKEQEKVIRMELEYCTKLFKRETMERFFRHFEVILNQVATDPDMKVDEIDILTKEERKQILELFNHTNTAVALVEECGSWLLNDLFKARVEKIPDCIALVGPYLQITNYKLQTNHKIQNTNYKRNYMASISITYGELENQSHRLARLLREKGVRPGTIVGIMGERSIDTVIGIWGILKAGGAYLPIDPGYPQERIDYMLKDSGAEILLKDNDMMPPAYNNRPQGALSRLHLAFARTTSLAYVMYTSGTTGKPKGVLVEQKSVVNVVNWFAGTFGVGLGTHLLQLTDFTFDPSVEDIFATQLHGGVLFIADKELVFYRERFHDFVQKHEIHIINYVPLVLNKLLGEGKKLKSVRVVISGGEKLDENIKDRIIKTGYHLYNNYGPTEVTVDALSARCTKERVTLGKPIFNVACYIMDNRGRFVPVGVVGELWISGAGIASGYLNRPELTNKKFLRGSPGGAVFSKSAPPGRRRQKTYKTGDLARWLSDGNIEFLGRLDRQVKIRGFRVELGEIEKELSAYKGINEAAAVPLGNSIICAYFTSSSEKSARELRHFLLQKLPDYMIPAYFIRLEEIPLTSSGKINIHALPDPRETGIETGMEYVPPTSEPERVLVNIWQKILGIQRIGVEDNFFELGGDSIRMIQCIVRIREEMEKEVSLKTFFENPTIKLLSAAIAGQGPGETSIPPIVPVSSDRQIPLSFPQEQVWFLQKLYKGYMSYHVPRVIRIKGELDISLVERTFSEIIRRHEILRTVFPAVDNQPVQKILEPFPVQIPVWDWSEMEEGEQEVKINAFLVEQGQKEFDLERGPMMRLSLLKLKPAEQLLVLVEHHLVHDGWTQGVMLREFIRIYRAYSQGKPSPLAELSIQYADFAVWQKEYMQGERLDQHLEYWKRKLAGLPLLLELPTDHPRPPVISGKGDVERLRLARELCAGLRKFSKNHDATLFMTMLAVLKVLMYRYAETEDLCLGAGIANRQCREMESMLGMVINTLPLRTPVYPGWSFLELLEQVKETCQEAYEHEDTPFEKIVEALRPERSLSYTPLFQAMFTFLDTPTEAMSLPGLELNLEEFHNRSSKFDLNIVVILLHDEAGNRENQEIAIEWEYSTDIFTGPTMKRMLNHYQHLLDVVVNRALAKEKIADLPIMEDAEIEQLLYEWNDTSRAYPADKTLNQLFEEQASRVPYQTAVREKNQQLTFSRLNEKANQVARLLTCKGVGPDNIIGIVGQRSQEVIVGILAILKAGGAFLVIDPNYPETRKKFMITDSQTKMLLVQDYGNHEKDEIIPRFSPGNLLALDDQTIYSIYSGEISNLANVNHGRDIAYVIYTSGSTGQPKGVLVEHGNVVNYIWWAIGMYMGGDNTNFPFFTSLSFDLTITSIFLPLLTGNTIITYNDEWNEPLIEKIINDNQVGIVKLTPSHLKLIPLIYKNERERSRIKRFVVGGEVLETSLARQIARQFGNDIAIYNEYGPTETTVGCITYKFSPENDGKPSVPIGVPAANIQVYLIDKNKNPVPVGVHGEIYISGDGVSRGYLNRPELTGERFIKNTFLPGKQMYKTGDLARRLVDRNIEFLGRIDQQVKIRGFRVEPGEIENRLASHEHIREAVVLVREKRPGDKYFCAYIVPTVSASLDSLEPQRLRRFLSEKLPEYMIPYYFVQLEQIPLTTNGKLDRKALPEPESLRPLHNYSAPRNEIEKKLVEMWSEILGIEKSKGNIGINDNFFELGGHSLKATIMMARIHKELDTKIDLVQIFKNPSISGLAALIEKSDKNKHTRIEISEKKEYYPLSSPQKRLYFLQIMEQDSTAYNLPLVMKLNGKIQQEKLEKIFKKLIQRHESFRTSFLMVNEEPAQRISEVFGSPEPFFQKGFWPPEAIINRFIRPFNLSRAPLLRVGLVETAKEEYLFMVDMHHIISDGISMGVLVKEFITLFEGGQLPQRRLHYKDYSQWEAHRQAENARQEAFWLKEFSEFADDIPVLDLPLDHVRPKVQRFEGNSIGFEIDRHDTAALKTLALQGGTTLYTVLLAIYNIFLARLSTQEVIIVGTPTASRCHADLEQVIGMFVNTLVLKHVPDGKKQFDSFLEEVKENTLNAFANQDYPYEELVEKVAKNRDPGRNPLFDTMLVLQNMDIPTIENPGLKLEPYPYERGTSKFDLTLICTEIQDHLACTLEYSTVLFEQETGQRFVSYLKKLVTAVLQDPEQPIYQIDMLPGQEKEQLLMGFNDSSADFPGNKTIYHLFEEQVDLHPHCVALVFDDQAMTFRDFDSRANLLAWYLLSGKGLQPGDRVAVLMDRSIELIMVLMAVMKSRGAYVPMDVSQPGERLRIVMDDASIKVAVSQQKYLPKLTDLLADCKKRHTVLCIEDLDNDPGHHPTRRPPTGNSQDPAYVMYTSGSSGIPKGVLVEHRSIINTIIWRKINYEYAPGHASLQVPPYFFDSSVTDIFTPLLGGARLVLVRDKERSDMTILRRIITTNFVSHFIVVPVFYNVMLEELGDDLKYLKMVCCAGDYFPDELIKKHFERLPRVRIFNEYGPTENSVNTTAYELNAHSSNALIGQPISNVRVYILDGNLSLCPIGVTGELCLAGSSLARGYLNHPEMTNEKFCLLGSAQPGGSFVKPPPGPPQNLLFDRVYRSGDLGRWLVDGNLEFLGRVDNQVKIRGIRVETGEIENQLMKYEHIKEAVVRVRPDENGTDCLCAYLVAHSLRQDSIKARDLKEYLSLQLPDYMVPSYFLEMEHLPLTPNGKLDVKALPIPRFQPDPDDQFHCPRNHIEKKLLEIWKNILGKDNIGTHDNFFYMGGDSIKSIQILSRMNRAGYKLEMKDIFQYPVIAELAPHVKKIQRIPDQLPVTGEIPLTPIQAAFFNSSPIDPHHFNQAVMFYSIRKLDKKIIEEVFARIQEHHDALRMTYHIDSETGKLQQINHGPDFPLSLQEYELNSPEELEVEINRIQESINLEKGPLMKLSLFHLDDGDRLLIVIHHLVIDGISWRILFEDIETLYGQYQRGETPVLPLKTDAFKLWSEKLHDYTHHKHFLREQSYWTRLETESIPPIKTDFPAEENIVKDTRSVSFSLAEAVTALLLDKVNRCFRTEINDILLTALAMAIKNTFGQDPVLLALEGHGREQLFEDMDTSRTIGWFTTEYPVLIDVSYADDTGRQIKEIKETLRTIPNRGIGFGILKYLTGNAYKNEIAFQLKPQVIFNYLGQFDADIGQISSFKIARESTGNTRSLRSQREYELEISGIITSNQLSLTIYYNETHFKSETMASLAGHFQSQLQHIIAFCAAKETIEPTPSDFTYNGLTIPRLHQLMETYRDIEDIYTLSPMQEGMLFHALVDDTSASYFEQTSFRLHGELDIGLVEKSLAQLVKRHHILRTAFVHKDTKRPVQVLLKNRPVDFYYQDISDIIDSEKQKTFVRKFKARDKKRSFDLSKDILVRASILRLEQVSYEFIWSFHHILMDGWCIGILINEFFELYSSYMDNRSYGLPPVKPYRTYIQWLEKQDKEESGRFWENYLDCFEEPTGIPDKKPEVRENQPGYSNKKVSFQLNGDKTKMLYQLAARYHVTLNIVNQTIWGILLGNYNGKDDVIFGAVVSGRPFELEGVESMVGLFINTIPVRIRYQGKMSFHQLLQKVQAEAITVEPYHYHPLADIQSRSPLKQNLIDHLFVFENYPIAEQIQGYGNRKNKVSSFQLTDVDVFEQTNFDFNILLAGTDYLKITFQYNANSVDHGVVEQVAHHYRLVLDQVIDNEVVEIGALTLLTPEEKNRLLYEFNETTAEYSCDKMIHQLFMEQVELRPHHVALVAQDQKPGSNVQRIEEDMEDKEDKECHTPCTKYCALTYRELNKKSQQLAYLLAQKGVKVDAIVGIMMERSIEMIIGILGILKAGGAYLPIDPGYPRDRIDYMLNDSRAKILLTRKDILNSDSSQVINSRPKGTPYQLHLPPAHATYLAYVLYTSGSTGKPKGVMVKHRSVVNILSALHREYPLEESDTYLLKTSYTFDVSVAELFGWFLGGGRLAILQPGGEKDPQQILETIAREFITHINFVPSMFNLFVERLNLQNIVRIMSLRYIFLAGETLLPGIVKRFSALGTNIILENIYGPTEGTIYASRFSLLDWNGEGSIPIGKPLANIELYILGKDDYLLPVGIAGELCIAGAGLARGYLNRPELTVEKFCLRRPGGRFLKKLPPWTPRKNFLIGDTNEKVYRQSYIRRFQQNHSHQPFIPVPHSPIYRTGDRARWRADGNVEFLGRMDFQVKIRGFRVELGEIENHLNTHPLIKETIVIDRKDRDRKYLCAYFTTDVPIDAIDQTSAPEIVSIRQLKEYLEGKLPEYMVPSCFVKLDHIPLKANGKIDRSKLPPPGDSDIQVSSIYQAPVTNMQRIIADIWQEVLGREKIGIQDNFFDLGGNSLDFVAVSNKLREKLDKEVPVAVLFTHPFIGTLASHLTAVELPGTSVTVPGNFVMLNGSPHSIGNVFLVHEVLGDVGAYMEFSKQLGTRYNCWGVEAEKLKNYTPQNITIEEISATYIRQMKTIQPHGPYNLATWSWGGHLGLEMALQLEKMGETISFLAFFDCSGPDYKKNNRLPQFTLETEKNFLRKFFTITGNQAELEKMTDIQQLWIRAVEVLTRDAALVEELRQLLIKNALALPDYDNLSGEELVQYLNLDRIHAAASSRYIPVGKIQTPIHYFWAIQNQERVESWKDHCHHPVVYHEINGDHHSIFRNKEHIAEFARSFKDLLYNILLQKEDINETK